MARKQPAHLTDNALYFSAFTDETGSELYRLGPGKHSPTLTDIEPGPDSSGPSNFFVL